MKPLPSCREISTTGYTFYQRTCNGKMPSFFIEVNSDLTKVASNGADNIVFTLRSNLGQQAQPLAKVASGGELSRIALAIQVLTSDQSAIPTLIFDEIDVGISGKTASVVGKLLRQLGDKMPSALCDSFTTSSMSWTSSI